MNPDPDPEAITRARRVLHTFEKACAKRGMSRVEFGKRVRAFLDKWAIQEVINMQWARWALRVGRGLPPNAVGDHPSTLDIIHWLDQNPQFDTSTLPARPPLPTATQSSVWRDIWRADSATFENAPEFDRARVTDWMLVQLAHMVS